MKEAGNSTSGHSDRLEIARWAREIFLAHLLAVFGEAAESVEVPNNVAPS